MDPPGTVTWYGLVNVPVDDVANPPPDEVVESVTVSPVLGAAVLRRTVNGPAVPPAISVVPDDDEVVKLSDPEVAAAVWKAPTPSGVPSPVGPLYPEERRSVALHR